MMILKPRIQLLSREKFQLAISITEALNIDTLYVILSTG